MNKKPIWSSKTQDNPDNFLTMQSDGELAIYSKKFSLLWKSNTNTGEKNYLLMQDNGNLVIINPLNITIWSSNTIQAS